MNWQNILVPPGAGVHTVSSGSNYKNALWKKYYNSIDAIHVEKEWKNQLTTMSLSTPKIFACPSDTGAGIIKGSNWGPIFLRQAFLDTGISSEELKSRDLGDIKVNPHLLHDDLLAKNAIQHIQRSMYPHIKHEDQIHLPVSALSQIDFLTQEIWQKNQTQKFLFLAGDHSCSYPIVKNWCKTRTHQNFAVLHFDAHTDLLQERLGIPYCFGTWANQIIKFLPKPQHLVQVGIRASGKDKSHWENTFHIKQHWAKEIKDATIETYVNNVVDYFKSCKVEEIYISFDVDVLDPQYLSCTGTAEKDGLFPHHIITLCNAIKENFKVSCIDVVEFAPFIRQANIPHAQLEPETSMLTMQTLLPIFWECL